MSKIIRKVSFENICFGAGKYESGWAIRDDDGELEQFIPNKQVNGTDYAGVLIKKLHDLQNIGVQLRF